MSQILERLKMQMTTALSTAKEKYNSASKEATTQTLLAHGFCTRGQPFWYKNNTACIEWWNNVISWLDAKHGIRRQPW